MMLRSYIRPKRFSFRALFYVACLIPVFIILSWISFFPLLIKTVESSDLSGNHYQSQPVVEGSQFDLKALSVKDVLPQLLVIDNGPEGLLLKSQVKTNFFESFKPDAEFFQMQNSEFDDPLLWSNFNLNDPDNDKQLEIFRLKQKLDSFNYGVEYRYVGKNLTNPTEYKKKTNTKTNVDLKNDQEGVEVWGGKKIGPIGLKTFFSRFWNNVDRDPEQTQLMTNIYGLELNYKMDSLPVYFSLSHSREESESTIESDGSGYQGKQKETYGGSLYYCGGKSFNMKASSSYSPSQDLEDPNKETKSYWHEITTTIRPVSNLFISPTVSYGEHRYLWYGERTENPSASLSVTYTRLFDVIDLSLWGEYSRMRNTDGYQDAETLSTSLGISWDANYWSFPKIRCCLDFGYDQYDDKIYQSSSYDSFSTSLQLKFQL